MREILFRGKREDNGNWIVGSFHKSINDCYIIPLPVVTSKSKVIPETVGQFTGLTDKNGTKIFEGDIITISSSCVCMTGIVEFHDCGFEVHEYDTYEVLWYYPDELEVIGNIHDNPEMLEATQDGA